MRENVIFVGKKTSLTDTPEDPLLRGGGGGGTVHRESRNSSGGGNTLIGFVALSIITSRER